mmetsp:Transcript_24762/g.62671  ORF Transcript_24762/g.62671 Transcript_24762/m.62671 type:complete len:90 (-) Transcript_24762:149-418(-)
MGFLAGWPGLPNNEAHSVWYKRLGFGVKLWLLVPPSVKFALAYAAVRYGGVGFFRSVLPVAQDSTFDEQPPPPRPMVAAAEKAVSGARL